MAGDAKWLTTGEAAELLDMHPESVRRYGKDGLLRIARRGKGWRRVSAESVHELARIHEMPEGPERDMALEALVRRNRGLPEPE